MSISWSSVSHVFASGYRDMVIAARAIAIFNKKIQPQEAVIEELTSLVPVYGPEAELIERLAFACLGEFAALIQIGGSATAAAANIPQMDPDLLKEVESMMQKNPQLVQKAANLFGIKK